MKKVKLFCLMASLTVTIGAGSTAMATTIYTDSDLGTHATGGPSAISLTGLAGHSELTLNFDLFIFDSWDGNIGAWWGGPDLFGFTIDGTDYSWAFDNMHLTYETNPDTTYNTGSYNSINTWGPIDRQFVNYQDGFTFAHSGTDLTISFWGSGLQDISDESWQVTNLVVGTNSNPVPEPTTMLLFGTGLAGLAGSRLRKKKRQ